MSIIAFDLDGTLCSTGSIQYQQAKPFKKRIKIVNELFDAGHIIKIYTARGGTTGLDWRKVTEKQLKKWGVRYHFLITNKEHFEVYICDRSINSERFFNKLWWKSEEQKLLENSKAK